MAKDKKTNNNEPSEEEINRAYALEGLGSEYIRNLAVTGFGKGKEGEIPRYGTILDTLYHQTIENSPDDTTWNRLFKGELSGEGGSLNKYSLMGKAQNVILQSLPHIYQSDALKLMGKDGGEDKPINELDEESRNKLMGGYIAAMVNEYAEKALRTEREFIVNDLEKILKPESKSPKK